MPSRTVLTTGANSGIGLATVLELARRGYRSVGTVRSDAKAEAVHKAAADAGVEVVTELLDVTVADACAELVSRWEPWGVVNNAGYSVTGAIEDIGDHEARQALETMVVAPARLARLALPHMRDQGGGRIVNVSSIMGLTTTPLTGWYQAAKHALEGWSDALRMEVAHDGIRVVLVEPGGFKTGIWAEAQAEVDRRSGSRYQAAYRRSMDAAQLAQVVMGDPGQVAKVIARALGSRSPRARYLVGADAQGIAVMARVTPTLLKDTVTRLVLGL